MPALQPITRTEIGLPFRTGELVKRYFGA